MQEILTDFGEMSKRAVLFTGKFLPCVIKFARRKKSIIQKGAVSFLFFFRQSPQTTHLTHL